MIVGDLMLDVVIAPHRPIEAGTDVPGHVRFSQGGSAASTARWLARLGVRTTLVCAVGRDPEGRALTAALEGEGVRLRATRVAGERTGRIGVLLAPNGERSFVADRAAADRLTADDLSARAFAVDLLHLPAYSLLSKPLGLAGRRAVELARAAGALVSLDLSSVGPLLARGRRAAVDLVRDAAPDLLFATALEGEALVGDDRVVRLADLAPLVIVKRGRDGASVFDVTAPELLAFHVATTPLETTDTTGAGDAFDAGFLASWLAADIAARHRPATLRRAVLAAHRAASRQLVATPRELTL